MDYRRLVCFEWLDSQGEEQHHIIWYAATPAVGDVVTINGGPEDEHLPVRGVIVSREWYYWPPGPPKHEKDDWGATCKLERLSS